MSRLTLWLVLLPACSDYQLEPKDDIQPGGFPEIAWSPEQVSKVVCDQGSAEVTVFNEGDAPLNLSDAVVSGEGWDLAEAFTPQEISPGESITLALVVGPGDATLTLTSDDEDEGLVEIPLSATQDGPPTVSVIAPTPDEILDVGGVEALLAEASDAEDPKDQLLWQWVSDVDGELGSGQASSDGLISAEWRASEHSEGAHTLTLTVTDSCGNTAQASTSVCQQAGYVEDELDISNWHFEGSAQWIDDSGGGYVELTQPANDLVGSAFKTSEEVDAGDVEIRFSFYVGGGTGADGFSVTALDTSRMSTYLGGTGCGMGYGGHASCTAGPALPGWTLEMDTYDNGPGIEPTPAPHMSFHFDGDVDYPVAWAPIGNIRDGAWHTLELILFEPHVTVILDGTTLLDNDLSGNFAFPAYVGFTAGTGGLTDYHLIDSLQVTRPVCGE